MKRRCANCVDFDGDHCTKDWNNLNPSDYIPERDDKSPDDYCEEWKYFEGWEDV